MNDQQREVGQVKGNSHRTSRPKEPDSPWANAYLLMAFASIGMSAVAAGWIPDTVLSDHPWLARFADFVAEYVPAIDKLTALSTFPQVTRLFMALEWAVAVPLLVVGAFFIEEQPERAHRLGVPEWAIWMAPILALFLCWAIYALPMVNGSDLASFPCRETPFERGVCMMSESRFWLGLFGSIYCFTVALIVGVIHRWPRVIRMYYTSKSQ